jgi:hypothetical protein
MRLRELLEGIKVGNLNINGVLYVVDKHSLEQAVVRNVLPSDVDRVLKKVNPELFEPIDNGQKVWVYDEELNVGIGLRRVSDSLKFMLMTVVSSAPFNGPTPILRV